jgi:hypothetical protein
VSLVDGMLGWVFPDLAGPGKFVLIGIDINQYLYLRR